MFSEQRSSTCSLTSVSHSEGPSESFCGEGGNSVCKLARIAPRKPVPDPNSMMFLPATSSGSYIEFYESI